MLTPASLAEAMGNVLPMSKYVEYFPFYVAAMLIAEVNTVNRAAAWHSQLGHESLGLKYMAEIQTYSPDWNWDRTRYRGRGPIQLTWLSNYQDFSHWCRLEGLTNDPDMFVNNPELVEEPKWGFLAAAWYWLYKGPRPEQINDFADKGDILAVSRCVNGWFENRLPNHYGERKARWERCLAMGDRILPGRELLIPEIKELYV